MIRFARGPIEREQHGAPMSLLPTPLVVRTLIVVLAFASVLGIYLLIATPRLPHERERTSAAPAPATPARRAPAAVATVPPAGTDTLPTPTPEPGRYTIQAGDTLNTIALQFNTTVAAIRAANPGLSETLQIGQEITIPVSP